MGMNDTPQANRVHIGFFGCRNAGKSSLVNAVTGQDLVIVSDIKGTTTDPVLKSMELLPLGPVLIIDTPGIDDEGELGEKRIQKTRQILNKTGVAVLVADASVPTLSGPEEELIALFKEKNIPWIIACNKGDLLGKEGGSLPPRLTMWSDSPSLRGKAAGGQCAPQRPGFSAGETLLVSAKTGMNISLLKERIAALAKTEEPELRILSGLVRPGDFVVLVTPIDSAAPKGRLILPQQQTIRDILETDAAAIVVKEGELKETLKNLGKRPALVITDSQAFARVAADTPEDIPLTSFSILFARLKGFLAPAVRGAAALDRIEDGDKLLVCEGCTHHRQCGDIGTVKLPRWIKEYTARNPEFVFSSGGDFPEDLSPYKLVIHCGACMLGEREMRHRRDSAARQGIPFTNYGIVIARITGVLERSLSMFDV